MTGTEGAEVFGDDKEGIGDNPDNNEAGDDTAASEVTGDCNISCNLAKHNKLSAVISMVALSSELRQLSLRA